MEGLSSKWESVSRFLEAALRVLLKYPLCDRCLGRLFARLGKGLDNSDRGRAIRTLLSMFLEEVQLSDDELKVLALNSGLILSAPQSSLTRRTCYICSSEIDKMISDLEEKALSLLKNMRDEISGFLVGVKVGSEYEKREQEVIGVLGLDTWESIRRELKRLVGKHISEKLFIVPDFSTPDILVMLDLDRREVALEILPVLLRARYVKIGRYISQMPWVRRDGTRRYKLSVYETCQSILELFGGKRLVLHATGREDADARMLGEGRPMVVEVKDPVRRSLPSSYSQCMKLESAPWIQVVVCGKATREYVRTIKSRPSRKTYRIVAIAPEGLSEEDTIRLLDLSNKVIHQRTPTRVRRRKDMVRHRRVYEVSVNLISRYLIEILVRVDGGLYIKELVDGDNGRTTPSFSEVTGKNIRVVMLDVVRVKPPT